MPMPSLPARLRATVLAALGALALLVPLLAVSPAQAAGWQPTLCVGYSGCVKAGHSDGGYSGHTRTSYWRQYAGHNCTNYVAYRLIKNGASSGWGPFPGNAESWGSFFKSQKVTVNHTPAVGAIAWWKAYANGYMGATGHVAYVESVRSDGSIVVTEDNYGGNFDARVYGTGSYYPTGFIHLKDVDRAPSGSVSSVTSEGFMTVHVTGKAKDPDTSKVVAIKAVIGGSTYSLGSTSGGKFNATATVNESGLQTVKVYATSQGKTKGLGSRSVIILGPDADGDGIEDGQRLPRDTDVNSDGRPDIVGFARDGVMVALNNGHGFNRARNWIPDFGTGDGWSVTAHPRTVIDMNRDGKPDVVGFASHGVYVALSTGRRFLPKTKWYAGFGYATDAGGWKTYLHPRTLVDMNKDRRPDIVGFSNAGVMVALNNGHGFNRARNWRPDFGPKTGGWSVAKHPRMVIDVNKDGRPDVVGFGSHYVYVALNNGRRLLPATRWYNGYDLDNGWTTSRYPRTVADVNKDGRPDIVGFAKDGVMVALNNGKSFSKATRWISNFGPNTGGWSVAKHPRTLVDVNKDGRPDIVGFGTSYTYVALNTGRGFAAAKRWYAGYGYTQGWRVTRHPRDVVDMNKDGRPDIVGFDSSGVVVALNNGHGFSKMVRWTGSYGYNNGWRTYAHPRLLG